MFPIQSHLKTHNPSLPTSSPPIPPRSPSSHQTEESLPELTSFEGSTVENPTTENSSSENSQNNSVILSQKRTRPARRAVSAKRMKV